VTPRPEGRGGIPPLPAATPIGQRGASANTYDLEDGRSIVTVVNSSGTTQKTHAYATFGNAAGPDRREGTPARGS
jgi:hypothetical protein